MPANDEKDIEELYENSLDNQVEFLGKKEVGDLKKFFKVVDLLASRYGLGGFKSLEDFAEMVNQTDPVVLNYLQMCAVENEEEKWGGTEDSEDKTTTPVPTPTIDTNLPSERSKTPIPSVKKVRGKTDRHNVRNMLREFGIDKKDLDNACEKIDNRKIELKDYSWVDKAELFSMSEEKFKETLKDMHKDNEKSTNFNVSDDTIRAKHRKMNGRE